MEKSEKVIFRILTAVKTRNQPGKCIFFDLVFAEWSQMLKYAFGTWTNMIYGHQFSKKCQKPHFLGLLAIFLKFRSFRKKSGRVSFHHLWSPNLMQKIRKILGAIFREKWDYPTNRPTIPAWAHLLEVRTVTSLKGLGSPPYTFFLYFFISFYSEKYL